MKTMKKLFSMAALALVGATFTGCSSSDDNIIDQPQQPETKNNVVTLTTTVGFDETAGTTRALSSTGVKTFAAGETMALVYKNTSGSTVKVVSTALTDPDITSGGKSATFTFELTDPDKTKDVTYIYPAAMAYADGTVSYWGLYNQDGTLASLAANLDCCTKSGAWDGDNLPTLTLENQLAILAITLKDNAPTPNDLTSSTTALTVRTGSITYTVNRSAAAGPIYVAIRPTSDATITVTATSGTKNYTKTLTGKTYEAGNGYPVSWRMAVAELNITSPAVGQVIGSDGKNYDYASLPTGVTAVAKICYVSGSDYFLALALTDEGQMNWYTAQTTCAGHTPAFTGGTWKLASKDEWKNMISAAGSYDALRDGFSSVGGTNLQDKHYWSSTENYSYDAWNINFYNGIGYHGDKVIDNYVRARLAFTTPADAEASTPAISVTSPSVGQVIGSDGKNYDYASLPTDVTAVAKICYVTGSGGLALALTDEGYMDWSTAKSTCAVHMPAFIGGTWKLASKDEWKNMISAAGSSDALRNGFKSVGGTNLQNDIYWSSTESDSNRAYYYLFPVSDWSVGPQSEGRIVRACLAF